MSKYDELYAEYSRITDLEFTRLGLSYLPETNPDVSSDYEYCRSIWNANHRKKLIVYAGVREETIFPTHEAQLRATALHEWLHFTYGWTFNLQHEAQVALAEARCLSQWNTSLTNPQILAIALCDTVNQGIYYETHSLFVRKQKQFTDRYLDLVLTKEVQ